MNMQFTCLDLLPQSCDTVIRDSKMILSLLRLLDLILDNLIESQIAFYQDKNYHLFDPHIGENCCQIRTLHLLLYALHPPKLPFSSEHQYHIEYFRARKLDVEKKIKHFNEHQETNHTCTFIEYLKKHELLFLVGFPEKYIFVAYFLTKFKRELRGNQSVIDYAKIASAANISQKLVKKCVRYYQVASSTFCVNSIVHYASELGYTAPYIRMLKTMIRKDDDDRSVLPCYFLTEVIITKLKEEKIPVIVVLQNIHQTSAPKLLYFHFDDKKKGYRFLETVPEENWNQPAFVIRAETEQSLVLYRQVTEMGKKIEQNRLTRTILNYMATHPQYSGRKLSVQKENPFLKGEAYLPELRVFLQRFTVSKTASFLMGCHHKNKSFFFIQHIFCDTYRHLLHKIDDASNSYAFRENLTCWESIQHVL